MEDEYLPSGGAECEGDMEGNYLPSGGAESGRNMEGNYLPSGGAELEGDMEDDYLPSGGAGISGDLIALDLRDTIHHLNEITGDIPSPEILSTIFSRFCIGK